jgi:trimeric autotransporter adhesin
MTSKNQVSPVIRISRGERDASARATHLKAASKKYLETTIERKQMSTTTNFKRIALVAVAALGLGVLSSVPSQAVINSDSLTLSSATAAQTTAETFTASSAIATVSFFGAATDSLTVTAALVSTTAAGNTALPVLRLIDTSSAWVDTLTNATTLAAGTGAGVPAGTPILANVPSRVAAASSSVTTTARYAVYLATSGAATAAPTTAGTYVVRLTPTAIGVGPLVGATAQTLTITVTTAASQATTVSTRSTVLMAAYSSSAGVNDPGFAGQSTDSTVVAVKTASSTAPVATIYATGINAAGTTLTAAGESLTVTITGAGTLGTNSSANTAGTSLGRSISVKLTDYVKVFPDGNSGVATITFTGSVSGTLIGTKTVTFSDAAATKYATPTIAATDSSVIAVGGTTKVSVLAQDAASNLVSGLTGGTDYWAYSSNTAIATVATYSFSSTTGYGIIVTGVSAGEAEISFGNASTFAAATIKSAPIKVRVGTAVPSNVTVTLDKSTYAPGEKMTMTVTILNAAGLPVVGALSYANIFSATGVTSSVNLQSGTLPTGTIADYSNTTNTKTYTLYAPVTGGPVVFSWTGGTALATANQVARSVTVNVTDSGAAALAAVTALATTVASLRTLIVTLTNLVLKIQKKVRA